jgi:hypothetical protein
VKPVDSNQVFEAFLREWTEQRIWSVDDFLGEADQDFLAEKRSIELIALARERGFDEALTAAVKPYGGVLWYVRVLFSTASFKARS